MFQFHRSSLPRTSSRVFDILAFYSGKVNVCPLYLLCFIALGYEDVTTCTIRNCSVEVTSNGSILLHHDCPEPAPVYLIFGRSYSGKVNVCLPYLCVYFIALRFKYYYQNYDFKSHFILHHCSAPTP